MSRKWTSYVLRAVFVFLLATIVTMVWASEMRWQGRMSYSAMSRVGRELFSGLFITEIILVSLVGPIVTGGLIAQERERRTLDLLFMTPMRDIEIVLGKFLSRVAYLFGLILLSTPVLLGCLIFGGVSTEDILLATLFVFICGLWSAAVGMFLSGLTRKAYLAIVGSYLLLLFQCIGLTLIWGLVTRFGNPSPAMFLMSPQLYSMARILEGGRINFWGEDIWPLVAGGYAALGFLVAMASARFLHQPAGGGLSLAGIETRVRHRVKPSRDWLATAARYAVWGLAALSAVLMVVFTPVALKYNGAFTLLPLIGLGGVLFRIFLTARRRPSEQRRVWENPVAWKEVVLHRSEGVDRMINVTLLAIVGFLFLVVANDRNAADNEEFHGVFVAIEHCATLFMAVVFASAAIAQESEAGRLETLLGTPLAPVKIIFGIMLGVAVTIAPLLGFMLLNLFAAPFACAEVTLVNLFYALGMIAVQLLFHTILALYVSLATRRVGLTIGICLSVSLVMYLFLPILMAIVRERDALATVLLHLNPAVAVYVAVGDLNDYSFSRGIGHDTAYAISFLFYFIGAVCLFLFAVTRFNRFVQRRA